MTRYLVDTHVLLKWAESPGLISEKARLTMSSGRSILLFSHASIWELYIKMALGKLALPDTVTALMDRARIKELSIAVRHLEETSRLPHIHGDPFDRLLIAQARMESLTLITSDITIPKYDVTTLAA